jgi:hypothetical protein
MQATLQTLCAAHGSCVSVAQGLQGPSDKPLAVLMRACDLAACLRPANAFAKRLTRHKTGKSSGLGSNGGGGDCRPWKEGTALACTYLDWTPGAVVCFFDCWSRFLVFLFLLVGSFVDLKTIWPLA